MTVTTPIAARFDAQAAAGQVTAVKPATVETNSIEEGDGCNGRLGAGLTERNLTLRRVGPACAEPWCRAPSRWRHRKAFPASQPATLTDCQRRNR